MPFALPFLADFLWAVAGALFAWGGVILARAFKDTVGSLPWPIGSALAGAFGGVVGAIAEYVADRQHTYWNRISAIARAWPYLFLGGITGIINVLTHHASQLTHLNNTTIPQAANNAQTNAYNHADSLAASLQGNIDQTITQEHHDVVSLQNNINSLDNYVNGPFATELNTAIRNAESGAEAAAHAELASVEADLVRRIGSDEAIISNLQELTSVTLPAEIKAAIATAEAEAHGELTSTAAALTARLDDLQRQINDNAVLEQNALAAAEVAIGKQQAADLQTAEGYAAAQTAAAEVAAQTEIATEAAKAAGALATESAAVAVQLQTLRDTETIQGANIGVLEQVTSVAIPASIAAVGVQVASIAAEIGECMVSVCDGPNNWQNLLNTALGVASFAEIAAFLAAATKDPKGEAAALAGVASDTYNAGHALLDSLLSL